MTRSLCALLLVLATAAGASPAEGAWVRVESPNFVVFGEVGEKRTREYAAEFERFRDALARVATNAAAPAHVPTVVFIFKDQRSMGPYRPRFKGKPIELSGYFAQDATISFIMLSASHSDDALRTIFHEYSHLVIANSTHQLPLWVNEGLAEYYSTFEISEDGRDAILGRTIRSHLVLLNDQRLLPLEELLDVRHESPLYNEGSRRSVFYAQAWAIVHMLLNGDPDRTEPFKRYLEATLRGTKSVDAWRQVFGEARIIDELKRYVARNTMRGYRFTFEKTIAPTTFTVTTPSAAEVHAALGDMRRLVTEDQAAAHIGASPDPTAASALAVKGLLKIDEENRDEALPLLVQAAKASSDWLVSYRAATGLERIASNTASPEAADTAANAGLEALEKVRAARPDLAHAHALRALMLGPGDEGVRAIRRARELAPGIAHYAIWQAEFHASRGEFTDARALLAPLLSPTNPLDVRDYARSVMGRVVTEEQARSGPLPAVTPADSNSTPRAIPSDVPGTTIYLFRELQTGEQRLEGRLERIECPRSGPVLHAQVGERRMTFTIPRFDAVEFITYVEDTGGAIGCGTRATPERVYLTFIQAAGAGTDGTLVAVEFLPPGAGRK